MSGYSPIKETLVLTRGADYVHRFQKAAADPDFPEGTTAEIVITRGTSMSAPVLATWPVYDVNPDALEFWVQTVETDAIPDRVNWRLLVHYPAQSPESEVQDFCWMRGTVKREQ